MAVGVAIAALALAVLLIRLGWGGRKGLSGPGWAIAVLALAWLTWSDGAWGLATGLTAGAVFALVVVLHAGATSPPRRVARDGVTRTAARLQTGIPDDIARPADIARRFIVFLLVVPVAFLAAQWLAFAINAAMKGNAPLDANAVSTMMFVQPVAWSILMAWQMMLAGPRQMLVPPGFATVLATLIWIAA